MKFSVEHTKTTMLSEEQLERIIEIAGSAFVGNYEQSIRDDFAKNMEIIILKFNSRIIGFLSFSFEQFKVNGITMHAANESDLVIENNNAQATYAIFSSMTKILLEEKEKCGGRFFIFMPTAGYHMYKCMSGLFRIYYPNLAYETPFFEKQVIDAFAVEIFGNTYDPASGLVYHPSNKYGLSSHIETYTEKELKVPEIAFFKKLNPRSLEGGIDLICMAEVTKENMRLKFGKVPVEFSKSF